MINVSSMQVPIPITIKKLFGVPIYYKHIFEDHDERLTAVLDILYEEGSKDKSNTAKVYRYVTRNVFGKDEYYTEQYMVGYYIGIDITRAEPSKLANADVISYIKNAVIDACYKYSQHGSVQFITTISIPVFSAYDVASFMNFGRLLEEHIQSNYILDSIAAVC